MTRRQKDRPYTRLAIPNGMSTAVVKVPSVIRLDLGCGPGKRQDNGPWIGVDNIAFPGVDVVVDLTRAPWPWEDNSVTEAHASHFLEHLTNFEGRWERVRFFNELYRIMIPGGKATLIFPHWCSNRYYGDPTHREAFSEMGFFYLLREWRLGDSVKGIPANAPHTDVSFNPNGYSCDFDTTWGYAPHPALAVRAAEVQQDWMAWRKEAVLDIHATLVAKK